MPYKQQEEGVPYPTLLDEFSFKIENTNQCQNINIKSFEKLILFISYVAHNS